MRPFVLLTAIAMLAFAGSPARGDDPKPPEKPPEKPADKSDRGYLGFTPTAVPLLSAELRAGLRITALQGVVVTEVVENAPAAKAGLKPGDFLLKLAGKDVPDTTEIDPTDNTAQRRFSDAFTKLAEDIKPGVEVELLIKREGEQQTIKAKAIDKAALEQIQKDNKEGAKPKEDEDEAKNLGYLGFEARLVSGLSYKQKKRWKVKAEKGIVAVRVLRDSPAQKAGLANGDVLVKYAGVPVPTAKEIEEAKDPRELVELAFAKLDATLKAGAEVEIVVEREGQPVTLKATAVDRAAIDKIEEASGEGDD